MIERNLTKFENLRKRLHGDRRREKTVVNIDEIYTCPYCGHPKVVIDYRTGQVICPNCGSVIQERLPDISRPEYRVYSPEEVEEKERLYKADIKYPNRGLGQDEIDLSRAPTSSKVRNVLERISIIHQRLKVTSTERNILTLQRFVRNITQKLGLPHDLLDDVVHMYRHIAKAVKEGKIVEKKKRMYRLRELAAALLYVACKNRGLGFRIREILEEFNIDRRRLARILAEVKTILAASGFTLQNTTNETELKRFISTVIEKLDVPPELRPSTAKLAWKILEECRRARLTNGKDKYAISAAAIYIAVNILNAKRKQKEVAQATGKSDVTIRQRYQEIINRLEIIVEI
ncbi:MAG: hypothetical protein GXO10_05865 [Crenarchaeota archaeon]|nr:hypothetical protein [Thermoproteota archaeon]